MARKGVDCKTFAVIARSPKILQNTQGCGQFLARYLPCPAYLVKILQRSPESMIPCGVSVYFATHDPLHLRLSAYDVSLGCGPVLGRPSKALGYFLIFL